MVMPYAILQLRVSASDAADAPALLNVVSHRGELSYCLSVVGDSVHATCSAGRCIAS